MNSHVWNIIDLPMNDKNILLAKGIFTVYDLYSQFKKLHAENEHLNNHILALKQDINDLYSRIEK